MFCRNCGTELAGAPKICMSCGAKPMAGISFCPGCGSATNPMAEICVKCGASVRKGLDTSPKSRLAATLLAFFLGDFGAHRFYVGKNGTAVVMLLLGLIGWATIWIFGIGLIFLIPVWIWSTVDFIFAVAGRMRDSQGNLIEEW